MSKNNNKNKEAIQEALFQAHLACQDTPITTFDYKDLVDKVLNSPNFTTEECANLLEEIADLQSAFESVAEAFNDAQNRIADLQDHLAARKPKN